MRKLVILTETTIIGFNGNVVFSADNGPYLYVSTMDDLVNGKTVEVLAWCSKDGEPIRPIDSNKYDIKEL